MKIAVYYPWIYLTSGIERTLLEIAKIPEHQFTFYTNHFDPKNTFPEFTDLHVIELKRVSVDRSLPFVLKAAIDIANQKIDLSPYDLFMVHTDGLGDLITTRNHTIPTICFCHTPLRPVFDEHYRKRALQKRNRTIRPLFLFLSMLYKLIDSRLWQHYDFIFFNSQETLRRAKIGGLLKKHHQAQYQILHPGVATDKIKPSHTFKPFFLLPGRIMWTKNIKLAIQAFIQFKQNNPNTNHFHLIITGRVDRKSRSYLQGLRQQTAGRDDIQFIINPTDKTLHQLYHCCWAVISTAFNEDWGLTLLEANAHGKPVIAINRGGPKESQIHHRTGLLVAPTATAISNALIRLTQDHNLARELGSKARKSVKRYDWQKFRHQLTLELKSLSSSK